MSLQINFKIYIDMKTQHLIYCLAIAVLFTACKKNDDGQSVQVKKEVFSGCAQKGPFVNGSSVTISELTESLDQTGKIYSTIIANNSGSFEQKNIELVSRYVELKADGYYFNEISGATSGGSITLYALTDIEDVNSANVNVLTHLEKPRVEYLVKQERMNFADAKKQAQQEILAIFGFESADVPFETLDLIIDAKLLAISCILQSYLSIGDMMELMANISADIKEDGKLDNMALGSKLMNSAYAIGFSLPAIRDNLTKKYAELGINANIPNFEGYIESFINSDLYPQTISINYPEKGAYGDNILSDHVTSVIISNNEPFVYYSMTVDVSEWLSLRILIKDVMVGGCFNFINWDGRTIQYEPIIINEFTVKESGKISDTDICFYCNPLSPPEYITIEYYENGATTPTKVKKLNVIVEE